MSKIKNNKHDKVFKELKHFYKVINLLLKH